MRKESEIQAEIKRLLKQVKTVRPYTAFGESNRDCVQAQLDTLVDDLDEDDIYERWPSDDEEDGNTNMRLAELALEAERWKNGQRGVERPSDGWKLLCKKPRTTGAEKGKR